MGHNLVLLDINLSEELADFFPQGDAVLTTQFGLQPRADDMDVIDLANMRHSILVTDIKRQRRRLLHKQLERSATWRDVNEENLLIQAHQEGFPQVGDL